MPSVDQKRIAEQLKTEGNKLFRMGRYDAAADQYTEALALWPGWTVPLVNRAFCHKKKGNWTGVERDCRKALEINAGEFKAHYFLGQALEQQNAYTEAVSHLAKALETAREKDDSIKDEIWKELARIKYGAWQQQAAARAAERAMLRQQLDKMLSERHDRELNVATDVDALREKHAQDRKAWDRLFELAARQDEPEEIPNAFTCRLTMDVFREPVCTPSGLSYERTALLEHLQKVGSFDPVSRDPCTADMIIPNLGLRDATQEYLEEHPWSWKECL
ncbi:unnamed protein product [Ostreobium quekettii]|uniref:E3 ubiquitin-protein ligase CHIP n=1 Tax=Ostreobium quekettii TaxID=121088 RepID=A0A8S1IPI3_9CHLO|nr:unnamed protein product [Ostreobium quekettii]